MKHFRFSSTLLGIAGLALSISTTPAQTYTLTDLGVLPGMSTSATPKGINNLAQVAGTSGPMTHALRFTNGTVQDLGTLPGGQISTGWGINDLGDVVGDSEYSAAGGAIRHATLWTDGTTIDLGFLPSSGNYSRGNGINSLGEVVGHSGPSLDTSNTRAFIWDATNGMRDIGTLGGGWAKAFSINDAGQATGTSQASLSFHAFIWDSVNGMRDIGTIAGSTSTGNFINANGHVAGTSTINNFDNREHAFLYNGSTMLDLGAIGDNDFLSDRSFAYGINIHDEVVGSTYRPYQGGALYQIAFVYRDGQMFDLESLVDTSGADYRLYTGTGINDAGQIAVSAIKISTNEIRAVLLTPNSSSTDTVKIKSAIYTTARKSLAVQATTSSRTATLSAYITSTDTLIGPLTKRGSRFSGKFRLPTNPGTITVKSSGGGSATAQVTVR